MKARILSLLIFILLPTFLGSSVSKEPIVIYIGETFLDRVEREIGVKFGTNMFNTIDNEIKVKKYIEELDRRIEARRDSLRKVLILTKK